MRFLYNYENFLNESKAEKKAEKRIRKFFNVDYVIRHAIELNPKLSVWIINGYKDFLEEMMASPDLDWLPKNNLTPEEVRSYMKTGETKNENAKKYVHGYWADYSSKIQYILDWVNSFDYKGLPPEERDITKMTYKEAYKKSDEWHNSLVAGGVIEDEHGTKLMEFPDGFYWIDLETTYDRDEADAMGHCGNTNKGTTLYSLRDRKMSPHVTAAVDEGEGIVYQMKGRNNTKPIDKYHMYIVALLGNDDLKYPLKGFGAEYNKEEDFNPQEDLDPDLLAELKEKRPNIDEPVHTDADIDQFFEEMIEYYYIENRDYGFRLVSWVHDACGYKEVVECLESGPELLDILIKEYPDKVNPDSMNLLEEEQEKRKLMLEIIPNYVNSGDISKQYNISLGDPKKAQSNKWDELANELSDEQLEAIMKNHGIYDRFEEQWEKFTFEEFKDRFKTPYYWDRNKYRIEYDEVLEHFFDTEEEAYNALEHLFNYENENGDDGGWKTKDNYYQDVWDIWDAGLLSVELESKLSRQEKEAELADMDYWRYTGEY